MEKCTHETTEVRSIYDGSTIDKCTWACGEPLIVLDLGNHQIATYTAAELAALRERVAELEAALKDILARHLNGCPEPDSGDYYHKYAALLDGAK